MVIPIKLLPYLMIIVGAYIVFFDESEDASILWGIILIAAGAFWLYLKFNSGNQANAGQANNNVVNNNLNNNVVNGGTANTVNDSGANVVPDKVEGIYTVTDDYKICSQCGTQLNIETVVCPRCGARQDG